MALHLDLVRNDWLAGTRRVIGTASVDGDGSIIVEPESLEGAIPRVDGRGRDPEEVLDELYRRLDGTYLEASIPHDADECQGIGHEERMPSGVEQTAPA